MFGKSCDLNQIKLKQILNIAFSLNVQKKIESE